MPMLQEILDLLKKLEIENIVDSSREASVKTAFFCNEKAESLYFDLNAIQNGSKVVIKIKKDFTIKKNETYFEIALPQIKDYVLLLQSFYKNNDIKKIAVTGTNGKSSTVHFGAMLCSLYGKKSATIGTNGVCIFEDGKIVSQSQTGLTTPTLTKNHQILYNLEKKNIHFVWMEVSSIGIEQGRVDGIDFDISCFTNLTQDHLDYHHTMEEYFLQKTRLFTEHTKYLAILNEKSSYSKKIEKMIESKLEVKYYNDGDFFQTKDGLVLKVYNKEIVLNVFGKFQAQNFCCALKALEYFQFDLYSLEKKAKFIYPPDGRMQAFNVNGIKVVIDYAHTPDALLNVLNSVNGNKIIVFGCGGDRDKTKRSIMGGVASQNANWVIITNDNPRNEEPLDIAQEIALGCENNNFEIILDRKEAICYAMKIAKENDFVIIAGKGSEDYQIFGNEKVPYSDVEVVISLQSI